MMVTVTHLCSLGVPGQALAEKVHLLAVAEEDPLLDRVG